MKPALASLLLATVAAHSATIWIEGEAPAKTDAIKHSWYDGVKKENLSGSNWLSHYGNRAGEATYTVKVADAGTYTIWARLNPIGSKPTWALDSGPATAVDFSGARGQQNLAPDGKPDREILVSSR